MTTQLEDQLREVLRDAPEPDWRALRAAIDTGATGKRRARMLRATVSGAAAAAAVVAIAVGAANSSMFEGQRVTPAESSSPTASGSPSSTVPDSTAFAPRVKLPNGDYRMPMAFPDVAPKGAAAPEGLERAATRFGMFPLARMASVGCLTNPEAATPQPWGSDSWDYRPKGEAKAPPSAEVTLTGWPTTTAMTAMQQLADNSGACAFDRPFRKVAWPGLAATEANQFVVEDSFTPGGTRYVAIRRVGDVTVDAWTAGPDAAGAFIEARRLVDESITALLASKALDAPQPYVFTWPGGLSEISPDPAEFILPAIDPRPEAVGLSRFRPDQNLVNSAVMDVPVLGAQVGDPRNPGEEAIAARDARYVPDPTTSSLDGRAEISLVWSSFTNGQRAFDEIVVNRGTARWSSPVVREDWPGHDTSTTFLASQPGQDLPTEIALRLEGNVLISAVAHGETQAEARTIATKLADEAAKNLASFGRGPDGRPGNGK